MTRARLFIVVVIGSLLAAAAVLSPKRGEQAAMLAGEGRHAEAIALLERRLAAAPGDPDILAALGRSYAALGEVSRAVAAFDAYLAARPDDGAAREREAELLLQGGMTDRYLDAMARVAAERPTPARVTRLIELYRLHGRADDEARALETYAEKGDLDSSQLERLGALLAVRGEWRESRKWLEQADLDAPPEASEGRFLLLEVMISIGAVDDVDARLKAWMADWRSPYLSGKLILRVAQSGDAGEAARLAVAYADSAPDAALDMASFLAGKDCPGLARAMLVRWADGARGADGPHLHAFVQLAARLGDPGDGLRVVLRLARSRSNASALGQLAEDLVDAFGAPMLSAVRPLLSNEVLAARPLFAAELTLADGNPEAARWYLRRVDPEALRPERLAPWLALCRRLEMAPEAMAGLAKLLAEGRLPADLAPGLARDTAKRDRVMALDLIWNAAGR
ncbi:tetratricopeptide repeat protein [Roseiarcus fermentans]|uniref:Tetratricopeptide repeat protein n=1 Tax=Roseiarcus fermentans TaxID=1473586 RepID=A0A366EZ23_9HYPH|nr:tetratricopeptide repeat protein [Roseiarcus fermentans]RBP07136.1 tetratricopeptide repeat protein [Roseiarcus fermentans]